jgi:hypothetical protein
MKRKYLFWLALVPLLALAVAWPWKQVVSFNIQLQDQSGAHLTREATGTFLDPSGKTIAAITAKPFVLGIFSIQWWTTNEDLPRRFMKPKDALSAKEVVIEAKGCETRRMPVETKREYHGLSLSPHGGGLPYYYVTFEPIVRLDCAAD